MAALVERRTTWYGDERTHNCCAHPEVHTSREGNFLGMEIAPPLCLGPLWDSLEQQHLDYLPLLLYHDHFDALLPTRQTLLAAAEAAASSVRFAYTFSSPRAHKHKTPDYTDRSPPSRHGTIRAEIKRDNDTARIHLLHSIVVAKPKQVSHALPLFQQALLCECQLSSAQSTTAERLRLGIGQQKTTELSSLTPRLVPKVSYCVHGSLHQHVLDRLVEHALVPAVAPAVGVSPAPSSAPSFDIISSSGIVNVVIITISSSGIIIIIIVIIIVIIKVAIVYKSH